MTLEKMGDLAEILQYAVTGKLLQSAPGGFQPINGETFIQMYVSIDRAVNVFVERKNRSWKEEKIQLRNGMIL